MKKLTAEIDAAAGSSYRMNGMSEGLGFMRCSNSESSGLVSLFFLSFPSHPDFFFFLIYGLGETEFPAETVDT